MGTTKEKRKYKRVVYDMPLEYREMGMGGALPTGSLTNDISEGGASIRSNHFISLAARLMTDFTLPTTRGPVKAISRVIWIRKSAAASKHEVGLQFLEMTKEDKIAIASFLNQL